MADDKSNREGQNSSSISMREDYEVRYWTEKFHVSKDELQRAVYKVGPSASAVEQEILHMQVFNQAAVYRAPAPHQL